MNFFLCKFFFNTYNHNIRSKTHQKNSRKADLKGERRGELTVKYPFFDALSSKMCKRWENFACLHLGKNVEKFLGFFYTHCCIMRSPKLCANSATFWVLVGPLSEIEPLYSLVNQLVLARQGEKRSEIALPGSTKDVCKFIVHTKFQLSKLPKLLLKSACKKGFSNQFNVADLLYLCPSL